MQVAVAITARVPLRRAAAAPGRGPAAAAACRATPSVRRCPPAWVVRASAGEGAAEPEPVAGGASSGDELPRAVSLPLGLPTAGVVFAMAGALKLLIMCFPYSEMAMMMWMRGRAELGVVGALKAIPLALALAAAAKVIVDRRLQTKRWVQVAIVAGGVVMLWLSRLIFARPKPSPLDAHFQRLNQERAAAAAEQRRAAAAAAQRKEQGHLLPQGDPEVQRRLAAQQPPRGQ